MHVAPGDPLFVAMPGICKCCNPSVFALRLTQLRTLATAIHDDLRAPFIAHENTRREFRLKVSRCGKHHKFDNLEGICAYDNNALNLGRTMHSRIVVATP